jgi:hypothetical protein
MAAKARDQPNHDAAVRAARLAKLNGGETVAGIPGPGQWLVAEYEPTALFSLKVSLATSSVGRTLVIPTPYAIKMALVDAGFRAGLGKDDCDGLLRSLAATEVRIAPPPSAVVTHTFVKVRQESRDGDPLRPYGSNIAYREVAHLSGASLWAFDLAANDEQFAACLTMLLPHVAYIGKRGSFVRLLRLWRATTLGVGFTQPVPSQGSWSPPPRAHVVPLDDFGPEADLETLSSFTKTRPKRERHRRFVNTIVPVGIVRTGPGFTEYSRG